MEHVPLQKQRIVTQVEEGSRDATDCPLYLVGLRHIIGRRGNPFLETRKGMDLPLVNDGRITSGYSEAAEHDGDGGQFHAG